MRYFIFCFLFFMQSINAATITAQTDRNVVHVNESFRLVFEATGSVDEDPDFTPLEKDFDILNRSQSSSISIINGSYKKSIKWNLALMAKYPGVITIPSVSFGKDQSPQLRLTVKPASTPGSGKGENLLIEISTSPKQAYVQGQLIVTVKLMSSVNITDYGIQDIQLEGIEAVVEQLGKDKQYQTQQGNKPYLVLERNYAIFPQQAGKLKVSPFLGEVAVATGRSNFYDPFRRGSQTKRVRSKALEINIKDIPATFSSKHWLPATEIQLVEEWPDKQEEFKVGEPVTRTLSLLADGLTSAQLPEISTSPVQGLKQYPDQPVLHDNKKADGIIGIREEKIALIPTSSGRFTLPAIEIPWWNVKTNTLEIARIAERTIQVGAAAATSGSPALSAPLADTVPFSVPVEPDLPETASPSRFWLWVSAILAIGWLTTIISWWYHRHSTEVSQHKRASEQQELPLKKATQLLHRACRSNDPQQCKDALLSWGKAAYPHRLVTSLGHLADQAGEPLKSEIDKLEALLYSPGHQEWNAEELLSACEQIVVEISSQPVTSGATLEPLYK